MDEKNREHIKKLEELLQTSKVLGKEESIYDFLKKPFNEIRSALNGYLHNWREYLKPIPNVQNDRLLFGYIPTLVSFSSAFYNIQIDTKDEEIKANCDKLRKEINENIVKELSPYILNFFKWDFQRRTWKHSADEYKVSYLEKVIEELDAELKGEKSEIVKKYIGLLLDYFIEMFDKIIAEFKDYEKYKMKREDVFKTRNQMKELSDSNKLSEFLDSGIEESFLRMYKPMAQDYIEGLIRTRSEFGFLIVAFIEAQNDYKKFISFLLSEMKMTGDSQIHEIRKALQQQDIKAVIKVLKSLFASVPHQLIKNTTEAYYHIFIHLVLKLVGCDIVSENSTSIGRIDAVIEFADKVYIIEFKTTSSEEAFDQIIAKKYAEPYLSSGKLLLGLGISFDTNEKNINENFVLEEIK